MNTKLNYYFDTEFNEDFTKPFLFGKPRHFIDLISIGIVCEDGRTYYAISKEFDLKAAWNKHDLVEVAYRDNGMMKQYKKVYWLRENVLKPIFYELTKEMHGGNDYESQLADSFESFDYSTMAALISMYGKSNSQIATEITDFCRPNSKKARALDILVIEPIDHPQFYAYFADYNWVLLCSLFGTMMKLPEGFPKYCIDLKQIVDEKVDKMTISDFNKLRHIHEQHTDFTFKEDELDTFEKKLSMLKADNTYPKQQNEHNALDDAQWNVKLHAFLKSL